MLILMTYVYTVTYIQHYTQLFSHPPHSPLAPPAPKSYLLHIAPLVPKPQFRKITNLHPLGSDEDAAVPPALEVPLARGNAAVVPANGLVERDADPGRAGGAGQGGDSADEGDSAALGGRICEAAAGAGGDVWVVVRMVFDILA